jgi:hypothetical protein
MELFLVWVKLLECAKRKGNSTALTKDEVRRR